MIINEMKEDMLLVNDDPAEERTYQNIKDENYELPDGRVINMSGERIKFTEQLFNSSPSLPGFKGLQHMVSDSINKSDVDIRRDLHQNLILSGGNSHVKRLQERLQKQVTEISPQNVKIKIHSCSEKKFSAWVGGSILSSLGSFQQMWMSKQEYEEHGAIMIERKCP